MDSDENNGSLDQQVDTVFRKRSRMGLLGKAVTVGALLLSSIFQEVIGNTRCGD